MPRSEKYQKLLDKDLHEMHQIMQNDEESMKEYHLRELLLTWSGGKFSSNWKVEYSNYLTDYGYERPDEYSDPAKSVARRLNNIAKKIKEDKPIDGKVNVKTLEECYEFFPEAENIINKLLEEKNSVKLG